MTQAREAIEGGVTPADIVGPNAEGIEPLSFGEIVCAIDAGHGYVNIHPTRRGSGEINDRDQKEFDR